ARVTDYRPISCCNVLFKCISKIIANHLKGSLKRLLVFKKAYDTVNWDFLRVILIGFGFHERMITWIMECVTTTSFSISINGSLHGYFKGKRGLHQGDPLSPYLFTLIMEVFMLMIKRRVNETSTFTYHRFCSELDLINLCFADDLFLFAHGDVNSAKVIKDALDDFKDASGLNPSMPKSKAYFCNVINYTKLAILNILPFEEDRLPVKYLGVPLVSSQLISRDCKELINKVQNRVNDWKNKSLSITRRLQLIQSVLSSMHVYWAFVFMLPSPWDVVCLPKQEGGLGIRRLDHFNKALMVSHVWKLLSLKESLWVKWIHIYKLKNRSFWDIPNRGKISWSWRKLLLLRPLIREFIWSCIGDGRTTFMWFDKWCVAGPLSNIISSRDIIRAGFSHASKVRDCI
nr:putative reverse transcriptase domain, reverse transcriptase zinc-binding domain protein [Tanacetum cinerariifolium]